MSGNITRLLTIVCGLALLQFTLLGKPAAGEDPKDRSPMPKLHQITLAMHQYHESHGSFPAHASCRDGKSLLSWRVHLLPTLGEEALYKEFRLDEAWDSPHNKRLIARMPSVYADPLGEVDPASGKTRFVVPIGARHVFTGRPEGVRPVRSPTAWARRSCWSRFRPGARSSGRSRMT